MFENLLVSWKLVGVVLAVDPLAIDFDIEDSAFAFDQFCVNTVRCFDGGRQTGGLRSIVSHYAVGDSDFHGYDHSRANRKHDGRRTLFREVDSIAVLGQLSTT